MDPSPNDEDHVVPGSAQPLRVTDALRLDFATCSGNPGMLGVGRGAGYTEEARLRQARRWVAQAHVDVVRGVLYAEWETHRESGIPGRRGPPQRSPSQ